MLIHYWYMHSVKKPILVVAKMLVSFKTSVMRHNLWLVANKLILGGNGPSFLVQMFAQVAKWVVIVGLLYLLFDQVKKIGFNFFSNMEGKGLLHATFSF